MNTGWQVDVQAVNEFLVHMQIKHEYLTSMGPNLFHYTDLAGLKGILENHDLWLTHSRYCNDHEEMTHGYSVAKAALDELRKGGAVASTYLDMIAAFLQAPEGVYICCFCEQDNLLSQWRNYAANGTGVSIQIDTNVVLATDRSRLQGRPSSILEGLLRSGKTGRNRQGSGQPLQPGKSAELRAVRPTSRSKSC